MLPLGALLSRVLMPAARFVQGFASRSLVGGIYSQLTGGNLQGFGPGKGTPAEREAEAIGHMAAHATNAAVALANLRLVSTGFYGSLAKYSAQLSRGMGRLATAQIANDAWMARTLAPSFERYASTQVASDVMTRKLRSDFEKLKINTQEGIAKVFGGLGAAWDIVSSGIAGMFGKDGFDKAAADALARIKRELQGQGDVATAPGRFLAILANTYAGRKADSYKARGPGK